MTSRIKDENTDFLGLLEKYEISLGKIENYEITQGSSVAFDKYLEEVKRKKEEKNGNEREYYE